MNVKSMTQDSDGRRQPFALFCLVMVALACLCWLTPGTAQAVGDDDWHGVDTGTGASQQPQAPVAEEHLGPDVAPVIRVWYGSQQRFGHLGKPQVWVNILGNASAVDGLASMSYKLNGGPSKALSFGPDGRRLEEAGDFNVEIAYTDLLDGDNQVDITATDGSGRKRTVAVTVHYVSGRTWAKAYSVDWQSTASIQDVAQVVDGFWSIEGDTIRCVVPGYDRLVGMGDITWTDYEVKVPITVYRNTSSAWAGVGILMRWKGATDYPIAGWQPKTGWLPLGAIAWYRWAKVEPGNRFQILGNERILVEDLSGRQLALGVPYWFKLRVETTAGNSPKYSFKVWRVADAEPQNWDLVGVEGPEDPQSGAFDLIAYNVDATFGDVTVIPLHLSLALTVEGNGQVLKQPDKANYSYGESVTLTPTPAEGWSFAGWGGGSAGDPQPLGDGSYLLAMNDDKELVGRFTQNLYTVTVTIEGDGQVLNQPGNPYLHNQYAQLIPVAGENSRFVGWEGPDAGSLIDNQNGTYSFLMNGPKAVTARFELLQRTLIIGATPGGVVEPTAGSYSYLHGEVVTLTVTPDLGWSFSGWLGASAGDLVLNEDGSWRLVMDGDKSVTARFRQEEYSVTIELIGKGTVSLFLPNPYHYGDIASLKPVAGSSWKFSGWGGPNGSEVVPSGSGDGSYLLTMNANKQVTAIFVSNRAFLPFMPVKH